MYKAFVFNIDNFTDAVRAMYGDPYEDSADYLFVTGCRLPVCKISEVMYEDGSPIILGEPFKNMGIVSRDSELMRIHPYTIKRGQVFMTPTMACGPALLLKYTLEAILYQQGNNDEDIFHRNPFNRYDHDLYYHYGDLSPVDIVRLVYPELDEQAATSLWCITDDYVMGSIYGTAYEAVSDGTCSMEVMPAVFKNNYVYDVDINSAHMIVKEIGNIYEIRFKNALYESSEA